MNISYPKREYEYLIKTSKWNIFLKYQQSNAIWTIEFLNKNPDDQLNELMNVLLRWEFKYYLPKKWYWTKKQYYVKCKIRETEILTEVISKKWEEVLKMIWDTLHKKYKSVFDWVQIPNSNRKTLFSSNLMALCKEYNVPWPEVLLRDYTLEQIERMTDWMIVSFNEYTKEWKRTNDVALSSKEENKLDKDSIDNIKKFRERMQKK